MSLETYKFIGLSLNEAIKTQYELAQVGDFFNIFKESKNWSKAYYLLPTDVRGYKPMLKRSKNDYSN